MVSAQAAALDCFSFQIVMSPHDQAKPFVTSYLKLLENSDQGDFQKVLEMKVRSRVYVSVHVPYFVFEYRD